MSDLRGRVALVSGGALRVGRHLALALAGAGADVVIHYNTSRTAALKTVAQIEKLGRRSAAVPGDLGDPGAGQSILEAASAALGAVDILINSASIFESGAATEMPPGQWERMQTINARAPLELALAMTAALPPESPGDVINLSDSQIHRPRVDYFAYTASKLLLHGMSRNLALELAPRVRVNEIELGPVLPPDTPPESYVHTKKADLPLAAFPALDDVASAMLFLLDNRSLTGETIHVDGGQHLQP